MDDFFWEKIYRIFNIPIYICDEKTYTYQMPEGTIYKMPFAENDELKQNIIRTAKQQKTPFIYLETADIYYGVLKYDNVYCFLGPLTFKTLEQGELYAYQHKYHLKQGLKIQKIDTRTISQVLSLIYYQCSGEKIDFLELKLASANVEIEKWSVDEETEYYQLQQSENEKGHNSVDFEKRLVEIVKNGEVNRLKELMYSENLDRDEIGTVAVNQKKQIEYLTVTMITLVSRAAIEGGLNPEHAYGLSDIYLQKLEKCKSAEEMGILGNKLAYDFANRVAIAKKERKNVLCVEKCKDYIAKNLRKPFRIGDIGPAIGVNRTYLARKFTEVEGMTIQQYLMKERCTHAANLLKYSDYSISIISEYFCFSSQSHFGKQFKEIYGVSPKKYRSLNYCIQNYKQI